MSKRVFNQIKKFFDQTELARETKQAETLNAYLTVVGFRKAYMSALTPRAARRLAKISGLIPKIGPYFDIVGSKFVFLVHPESAQELEPMFQKLKLSYTSNEALMEKRSKMRSKIIGEILGYECLGQQTVKSRIYFVEFSVGRPNKSKSVPIFGYLCDLDNTALPNAVDLIRRSEPFLEPLGKQLRFQVSKYW